MEKTQQFLESTDKPDVKQSISMQVGILFKDVTQFC